MISYIIGKAAYIGDTFAIIENNGIGYKVTMPSSSLYSLGTFESEVKVYTYMAVREDDVSLFGFLSMAEMEMFKLLITVSGVGPKGAIGILSAVTVDELKMAIAADDAKLISSVKGVGSKTAQKIVVELKGKADKDIFAQSANAGKKSGNAANGSSAVSEAIDALEALGFGRSAAVKAINSIDNIDSMNASDIIGMALAIIE